ncbi:MAG: 2'-5' RNA ligase family protein [Gaiellaceae bacterium]
METALVLVLDDAAPFDAIRREFAREAVALGIPFHVTLLYPLAPADELTPALREDLRTFFAARAPFDFELTRIASWPDVVYAVPEPDDQLRVCMHTLFATFPQWPPYGGVHAEVHPHATLGEEVDAAAVRGEIERRAAPHLPHRCQARDVALLEEFAPNQWRERERFPLG